MAAEDIGLRDANRLCCHLLPPGDMRDTGHFEGSEALVDTDRSFLVLINKRRRLHAYC